MENGIVVLVVEDEPRFHEPIKVELLSSKLVREVVIIEHLDGAVEKFEKIKDSLGAVLMDACLHGEEPDTISLTQHIRANFAGVIVAMSRDAGYRGEQMRAGCSHECQKYEAGLYLLDLLEKLAANDMAVS